jgi:hypothetical protein
MYVGRKCHTNYSKEIKDENGKWEVTKKMPNIFGASVIGKIEHKIFGGRMNTDSYIRFQTSTARDVPQKEEKSPT